LDFCSFLSVAYTTLNKLFAVFLYINSNDVDLRSYDSVISK